MLIRFPPWVFLLARLTDEESQEEEPSITQVPHAAHIMLLACEAHGNN